MQVLPTQGLASVFTEENAAKPPETGIRGAMVYHMGHLNIDPKTFERMITDFEWFEIKMDAILAAQAAGVSYNVMASDYVDECLKDKQFQILAVPMAASLIFEDIMYQNDFADPIDWVDDIAAEYEISYIQASHAIGTLRRYLDQKAYITPIIMSAAGMGMGIADKRFLQNKEEEADVPKGPWD